MKYQHYTPEEIDKRIESIRYVLSLPPNMISLNEEVRKDCESRLDELLRLKAKPQDFVARLSASSEAYTKTNTQYENEIQTNQPPIA